MNELREKILGLRGKYKDSLSPLDSVKEEFMTEWQPIETAPKDGTRVLLYEKQEFLGMTSEVTTIGHYNTDPTYLNPWISRDPFITCTRPTHWMPLPEPPH